MDVYSTVQEDCTEDDTHGFDGALVVAASALELLLLLGQAALDVLALLAELELRAHHFGLLLLERRLRLLERRLQLLLLHSSRLRAFSSSCTPRPPSPSWSVARGSRLRAERPLFEE